MRLMGIFTAIAMLLAAVGNYGVMAFFVSERTREIGIRIAWGAQRSNIFGMAPTLGLRLTLIGIIIGMALALDLTRLIAKLLFGVSATDPITFCGGGNDPAYSSFAGLLYPGEPGDQSRSDGGVKLRLTSTHRVAQEKEKFDAGGATIIGVSADSIARFDFFSADPDYCAGKFPVASDPDRKIATSYNLTAGSPKAGMKDVRGADVEHDFIERVTFVIGKNHKIVASLSSAGDKLSPDQDVDKALEIVQNLVSK